MDEEEKAIETKKTSPSKYSASKFINRDSQNKSGSINYHLDGKEDIKVFKNTYN